MLVLIMKTLILLKVLKKSPMTAKCLIFFWEWGAGGGVVGCGRAHQVLRASNIKPKGDAHSL
jgi:predicted MFS family arabinose efflux permease